MNVVIIGGGQKFGKSIADKFRSNNDSVYILSHKNYGSNTNHFYANFLDYKSVATATDKLIGNLDKIDILLYCTNFDYGPCADNDFCSKTEIDAVADRWQKSILIQAVIPHIISIIALQKMDKNSKIIFMTSHIAFEVPRNYCTSSVGHPGGKASQNHLMFALSHYNDKDASVYSISTHLDFDDLNEYNARVDKIFNNIKSFNKEYSGHIIEIYN